MSKKIARNSICPLCNSGLKYKFCCGKNESIYPNKTMFIGNEKINPTSFEKIVLEKLGNYPDDYIKPIREIGEVFYVLIDESNIEKYYSIGGIVVRKSEINNNLIVKSKLIDLVENYNIDYIHFTDIFRRKNILGNKRQEFIKEYIDIVKVLDIKAFSVCMREDEITEFVGEKSLTKEQCYMALTWKLMFNILIYLIWKYGENLIIEMWRESENITTDKRLLHQYNISGIIEKFPFANISIYRHYLIFHKEELLFSSLSDFIAYLTIGLYPKVISGISIKKLVNSYYELLLIYNELYADSDGIRIDGFEEMLKIVREREQHRKTIDSLGAKI